MKKSVASSAVSSSSVYSGAGVNLSLEEMFSAYAGEVCVQSYENNPFIEVSNFAKGNFRGPRGYKVVGFSRRISNRLLMTLGSDGVGTKTIITSVTLNGWKSACDLLAMLGGDVTRYGGLPAVMVNDLSVSTLGESDEDKVYVFFQTLMGGLAEAAKWNSIVVMSGETAQMSHCISSEIHFGPNTGHFARYVWSGGMFSLLDPNRLIDGRKVRKGDVIISLKDKLRSNGASAMRKFFREAFSKKGMQWYQNPEAETLVADAASPSKIFDPFFTKANGWMNGDQQVEIPISLIGNISGGGIRSKFANPLMVLGFSAELGDLHEPSDSVRAAVEHFGKKMEGPEAYETFNGGNGTMFAVPEKYVAEALDSAKKFGFEAKVSGHVLSSKKRKPQVKVMSAFDGKTFTYGL